MTLETHFGDAALRILKAGKLEPELLAMLDIVTLYTWSSAFPDGRLTNTSMNTL